MSPTVVRVVTGIVLVPSAALLAFLVAGRTAGALADSGSALADGATAALTGLVAAIIAAGLAGWAASRLAVRRLPWLAGLLLVLAVLALGWSRARVRERAASRDAPEAPREDVGSRTLAPPSPQPDVATAVPGDSLVGLLTLAGVQDPDQPLRPPLALRAAPQLDADTLFVVQRLAELMTRELGYEEPAAVVRGVRGEWLHLALPDGATGWVRPPAGSRYVPMAELVQHRLNYLTLAWDRRLAATPGGESERLAGIDPGEDETPATVHAARLLGGTLWLEVSVFGYSPCEGDSDPPVIGRGWLPAWSDGEPTAWYYSRGC